MSMDVVSVDTAPDQVTALLRRTIPEDEIPGYPFPLRVTTTYRIWADTFQLKIEIRNLGGRSAPIAAGWHPYFRLPAEEDPRADAAIDGLHLRIPADRYVAVDSNLLPTGEIVPVEHTGYDFRAGRSVGSNELDVAFCRTGNPVALASRRYRLAIETGAAFRYIKVFTPPDRRSIAIEPITAATDAFNRPELGLHSLEPEGSLTAVVRVRLSTEK
jgi:aldose 1-epimerase